MYRGSVLCGGSPCFFLGPQISHPKWGGEGLGRALLGWLPSGMGEREQCLLVHEDRAAPGVHLVCSRPCVRTRALSHTKRWCVMATFNLLLRLFQHHSSQVKTIIILFYFWERYILKGQIAFEGHWRLQSWTLIRRYPESTWCVLGLVSRPMNRENVSGWTWKHYDLNRLCPNVYLDTRG